MNLRLSPQMSKYVELVKKVQNLIDDGYPFTAEWHIDQSGVDRNGPNFQRYGELLDVLCDRVNDSKAIRSRRVC